MDEARLKLVAIVLLVSLVILGIAVTADYIRTRRTRRWKVRKYNRPKWKT